MGVSREYTGDFKGFDRSSKVILEKFQRCFKGVLRKFKWFFRVVQGSSKGVSECFKGA